MLYRVPFHGLSVIARTDDQFEFVDERDVIDSYFECVTACSLSDEGIECMTQCVELYLKSEVES